MDGINASISGMQTAAKRHNITASNIANLQTEGYQAKRAINGDSPTGGVDIVEIQTSEAPTPPGSSNVDLTTEVTNQIVDKNTYEANATMLKAQNDTLGTLLDILE
jgi:flagellar hook protein FlgE